MIPWILLYMPILGCIQALRPARALQFSTNVHIPSFRNFPPLNQGYLELASTLAGSGRWWDIYCPRYQQLPLLYWPRIDVPVLTEDHSAVRWRSPHLVYGALRSYSIIGVIVQRSPFRRASEFYTPLAAADIIPENLECGWGKCDAYSPFQ